MRTIKLPDLSAHIENDTFLEKAIRNELNNYNIDADINFEFPHTTSDYHVKRFTDVANKVNFWLQTHNRPGNITVSIHNPQPILEVIPEPELPLLVEVLPELAPIVEEQPTTKKKKNG